MAKRVLTGFDSAWSANNAGAIVSAIHDNGQWTLVGPFSATFDAAWQHVRQVGAGAKSHVLAIDQPLIVRNGDEQRPVEGVAGSPLGRRLGAACSSNRGEHNGNNAQAQRMMFGDDAPIWRFLGRLVGIGFEHDHHAADRTTYSGRFFFEVFPALANLGLFPVFFHPRALGPGHNATSVPKYNPAKDNFSPSDWRQLCACVNHHLTQAGVNCQWLVTAAANQTPEKTDQDMLDSLICLCIILHWTSGGAACVIGGFDTGYMVVPTHPALSAELQQAAAQRHVPFLS